MGKAGSKTKKDGSDFQLQMKKRFIELANGESTIGKTTFTKSTESIISPQLQSLIYESLSKPNNAITERRFLHFAEQMLGDTSQQAQALLQLREPLKQVLQALVSSFFKCEELDDRSTTLLVDFLTDGMPPESDSYTLAKFIERKIILPIIIKHISERLFLSQHKDISKLLPVSAKKSLLTPAALCLLYANLPQDSRGQWKLLFSSEKDGESFTKLLRRVDGAGPCLIIIETTSDRVFGAFASHGFICGPSHTGDNRCFLFEDRQILQIHNATGYNSNFCYLNFRQVSMPNGIGVGGSNENWSFFLHDDFASGTSTSGISTFDKCWLAGEETFKPKNVEIWQIGEKKVEIKEADDLEDEFVKQRIATNEREGRAVLELSGREFRSDRFRQPNGSSS